MFPWYDENGTSHKLLPKTHNSSLTMRKINRQTQIEGLSTKYLIIILKICQSHRKQKKSEKVSQSRRAYGDIITITWYPGWNPGTEKGKNWINKRIWIKHRLQFFKMIFCFESSLHRTWCPDMLSIRTSWEWKRGGRIKWRIIWKGSVRVINSTVKFI